MRWACHTACMEMRNSCNTLVRKLEGRRPLGRPRCRWEDNTRMWFKELVWEGMEWIHLAQDSDQCWAHEDKMNIQVLKKAVNFLTN
jgi:hypothetical protein